MSSAIIKLSAIAIAVIIVIGYILGHILQFAASMKFSG